MKKQFDRDGLSSPPMGGKEAEWTTAFRTQKHPYHGEWRKEKFWKYLQCKMKACQLCKKQMGWTEWGDLWVLTWHESVVKDRSTYLCRLKYCNMLAVRRTLGEVMDCTFFPFKYELPGEGDIFLSDPEKKHRSLWIVKILLGQVELAWRRHCR